LDSTVLVVFEGSDRCGIVAQLLRGNTIDCHQQVRRIGRRGMQLLKLLAQLVRANAEQVLDQQWYSFIGDHGRESLGDLVVLHG